MKNFLVVLVLMFIATGAFAQKNVAIERVDCEYCSHNWQYIPYKCHLSNGDVLTFENGCWYNQNGKSISRSLDVRYLSNGKLVIDNYLGESDVQIYPDYECYLGLSENSAYNYAQMSYANGFGCGGMDSGTTIIIIVLVLCGLGFLVYMCM